MLSLIHIISFEQEALKFPKEHHSQDDTQYTPYREVNLYSKWYDFVYFLLSFQSYVLFIISEHEYHNHQLILCMEQKH